MQIAGVLGYIDSPLIGNYDRPKIGCIDYKDIEDPAELLTEALKEWTTSEQDGIDIPRVTYSGEFLELKKLKEYGDFEAYGLGDTVRIVDEGLGADTTQRIMEYEYYPYEPKRSTVSLSNTKPSVYKENRPSNAIGNTIGTNHYVDSIKDSSNKLDPGWFQNIKAKLKTVFNGGTKSAVMHKTGDIWVDNPDNPTKAMGILADGFAIANSKLANGDWDWKTFGTADGFVADLIVAGILRAIEIEGVTITGSTMTGGTVRTAGSGARIEITGDTLTTYNAAGQKHGPYIYPRDGDMIFHRNGVPILDVGIAGGDAVSIQALSGYRLLLEGYPNYDWVLNYCATESWVLSQGYISGVSGASGSFTTADGKTVTVSDGLISSIV